MLCSMEPRSDPPSALSELDTVALVARVNSGDQRALELLFERHYPRVRRILRVRLWGTVKSREELDDVVQLVMQRALTDLKSYEVREDARFIDWLARIAQHELSNLQRHHEAQKRDARRNVAMENLRSGDSPSGPGFEPSADSTGVLERLSRRELETIVDDCLAELSEDAREVILLRDYAGGSWAWIAETLGRPTADAARQLHARSLATLGAMVQRRVGEDSPSGS